MVGIQIKEGFVGQVQFVVPRPLFASLEQHPLLHHLMLSDIGWYPNAQYHYRERLVGTDEYIVIFCNDGQGWCEIDGKHLTIQRHEALVLPTGKHHVYGSSVEHPWSIYWVHFKGTSAPYFAHQLQPENYTLAVDVEAKHEIINMFEQCFHALSNGFSLQQMLFCSQVLHHLLGVMFFGNRLFSPGMRSSQFHDLSRTVTWLRNNISHSMTLEQMAQHAGLSVSHFSQLFRQQVGYAPMEYFINLKVQHACHLLDTTPLPIKAVSYAVGYEDPYYFSRLFRKVMGVSPKAYREVPKG
jgi:AraC family transcriptional regulator, arabinose operon regulatory protein